MLVATFNETTAWAGKTIAFEGDVVILEDYGPITAAGVMEYDRQGQLAWAAERTQAWVAGQASAFLLAGTTVTSQSPISSTSAPMPSQPTPLMSRRPAGSSRTWWVVLAAVLLALVASVAVWYFLLHDGAGEPTPAADRQTMDAVGRLQVGIITWATNPYTGQPMKPGTSPGDYTYQQVNGGAGYQRTGYLSNGLAYTVP